MYFNSFQSRHSIELFNPNNRDLIANWKFRGNNYKTYDNLLRCSMFVLDSGGLSRMQLPKRQKDSLGIIQSYLVFQLYLFSSKQFSIEIAISDTKNIKHRLMFSTNLREITCNHFTSLIPLTDFPLGVWINLSIDVLSFVCNCFKFLTFKSIDSICLSASCKVRKIFTMRTQLICESDINTNDNTVAQEGDHQSLLLLNDSDERKFQLNLNLPSRANAKSINVNVDSVNEHLRIKQLKKEENSAITHINITNNNQRAINRYNNNLKNNSFDKENSKRISPQKNISNERSRSPFQARSSNQINETHDEHLTNVNINAKSNNYLVTKHSKKKKNNKKIQKKDNKSLIKESGQDRITKLSNSNDAFVDKNSNNNNHYFKIQSPQKPLCTSTLKRYQEQANPNEDVKDYAPISQHQSSIERKKIGQLNNFLYNSGADIQKQNTFESNHIEEINVYESQISLAKRESGIIQIDDLIGTDYIKSQNEIAKQAKDLFNYIQKEKEDKKKLMNEMLNENPLNHLKTKSLDRPFSPPITNQNQENNNLIGDNFTIADSITFGGKI